MFGNQLVLVVDSPRSVQELSSLNLCFRIRSALRARSNVNDQSSQANRIIVTDGGQIAEADDSIQIQVVGDLSPGF